jgi:hypothetical protein
MRQFKNLLLIFILLTELCFAQKTYKVTEGELQFINPENGMVVKKNDGYYQISFYIKNHKIESSSYKIENTAFNAMQKNEQNIYKNEIAKNFNFKSLKNLKFSFIEDNEERYMYQFNTSNFACFTNNITEKSLRLDDFSSFCYIEINNLKMIYLFENQVFIAPTATTIRVLELNNYTYKVVYNIEKHKPTNKEIIECLAETNRDYDIHKLKNGKFQLKNDNNEVVIKKQYDSIAVDYLIVCRNKKGYDLYNYRYEKLNQTELKAFRIFHNCIQMIQNNKCETIDYNGDKVDVKHYSYFPILEMPDGSGKRTFEFEIKKEENVFFARIKDFFGRFEKQTELLNTNDIENIFFSNNQSYDYLEDFSSSLDCPVYYKMKNGSYGISKLGNFIELEYNDLDHYSNYQDLQSVKGFYIQFKNRSHTIFKLQKNNLYFYFPFQKDFKYKTLGDFQGNFARFELPNGQKGWLDLEGKEYLDN